MEELDSFRHWQDTTAAIGNYINDPLSKKARVYVEMAKRIGDLEYEVWHLRREIEELHVK
jgi:hypothetical protein